ncbi:MAG: hypothetical protein H6883_09270 [Rhodobiaceae bacterium]|nr:hypothetical protein [Rhodobiaceae bacterium]MCC0056316.1 hypothetical protein [Rhodobiaceae bacterium]
MNPKRYLILLFSLVVPFMALHLAGMFWYLSDPLSFYRREWEYFLDIGDFVPGHHHWLGNHTPDMAQAHYWLYQDPRVVEVTTAEDGERISEPAERYEIVVAGDSQIYGSGFNNDETFPWRLGEILGRPVLNVARSDVYNGLKNPKAHDAGIVIFGRTERLITPRGLRDKLGEEDMPFYAKARNDQTFLQRLPGIPPRRYSLIPIAWARLESIIRDARLEWKGETERPYIFMSHVMHPAEFDETVEIIVDASQKVERTGKRFLFMPIPAKQTLYGKSDPYTRDFLKKLVPVLRARGVEVIDLLPALEAAKGRPNGTPDVYQPYDTHWSPYGASIAAGVAAEVLNNPDR